MRLNMTHVHCSLYLSIHIHNHSVTKRHFLKRNTLTYITPQGWSLPSVAHLRILPRQNII